MDTSPLRIGYCLSRSGEGVLPPTNTAMHAPCCDVFHLKDGKVVSFHCYVAVPILLGQLGVFKNLSAAIRR
jgi:hypothetical protein